MVLEAVGGDRRDADEAAGAGAGGRAEEALGAEDADLVEVRPLAEGADGGGGVDDPLDARAGAIEARHVAEVGAAELDAEAIEVGGVAAGADHRAHPHAAARERLAHVSADEAARSGDQDSLAVLEQGSPPPTRGPSRRRATRAP